VHRPPADTGGPSVRARPHPSPLTTSWMGTVSGNCYSTAFFAAVASSAAYGCKADFAGVTVQDVRLVSNRSEKQTGVMMCSIAGGRWFERGVEYGGESERGPSSSARYQIGCFQGEGGKERNAFIGCDRLIGKVVPVPFQDWSLLRTHYSFSGRLCSMPRTDDTSSSCHSVIN